MRIAREIQGREFVAEDRAYRIRHVRSLRELDQVHRLTHESIVSGGYMAPQPGGRLISYPELDLSPRTSILIAVANRAVIGTNSITADGPLRLHTDRYFPRETEAVRSEGRRLVSSFRIATDPAWRGDGGSRLVLDLVRWSLLVAIQRYRFETILCTFNPKHRRVYERLLGARTLAQLDRIEHAGIAAGAVLMRIDAERLPDRIARDMERLAERYVQSASPLRRERRTARCLRPRGPAPLVAGDTRPFAGN